MPYDYDELIAALAPRPALLHTPTQDRDANYTDVSACIAAAAKAWGPRGGLNHSTAATGTQMRQPETSLLLAWLKTLAQRRPQSALQA